MVREKRLSFREYVLKESLLDDKFPAFKKKEIIKEESVSRPVYMVWGRFNPPTIGHGKLLDVGKKVSGSNPFFVYPTQTHDKRKNPLPFKDKIVFLRKMFPKYKNNIQDHKFRVHFEVLADLSKKGFTSLNFIAGSDRVKEFQTLFDKFNGREDVVNPYNFDEINVISAGERDPDSEGVEGISASKLRKNALDNDFESFLKGMPPKFKEAKELFDIIRKEMGVSESNNSSLRDRYLDGKLFKMGDRVLLEKTSEIGEIVKLGPNYITVKLENCEESTQKRVWISDASTIS